MLVGKTLRQAPERSSPTSPSTSAPVLAVRKRSTKHKTLRGPIRIGSSKPGRTEHDQQSIIEAMAGHDFNGVRDHLGSISLWPHQAGLCAWRGGGHEIRRGRWQRPADWRSGCGGLQRNGTVPPRRANSRATADGSDLYQL